MRTFDALRDFNSQTTDCSAQTRGHNKQNEITSISGATAPTFDANGNLTKADTGRQPKYDAWNRLTEIRDSGNNLLATYRHDGLGRRIRETRGSTTTDLYYSSNWQVLEERVGSDVKVSYVWSPVYVDAMIARDRDTDANGSLDERLYALHDANFNIVGLVDTSGNAVERYAYDAFGGFVVLDASWGSRASSSYAWKYQFQGLLWDTDLAALVVRNRILGTTIGRFYQIDPIRFKAHDVNLVRFCGNSPNNVIDPSGLWGWGSVAGGGYDLGIGFFGSGGQCYWGQGFFIDRRTGSGSWGSWFEHGGFIGSGIAPGAPRWTRPAVPAWPVLAIGASGGVGANGWFFTNADRVTDLAGSFLNFNLNIGLGVVSLAIGLGIDPSSGTFIVTILPTIGAGGWSFSIYPTWTQTIGQIVFW
jgi:RHS repeat-associated protein